MMTALWLKIRKAVAIAAAFLIMLAGAFLYGRRSGSADEREQNLTDDLKDAQAREQATRNTIGKVQEVQREVDQMDDKRIDDELDKWMRK